LGAAGWDTAYGWGYLNGQRAYDLGTNWSMDGSLSMNYRGLGARA